MILDVVGKPDEPLTVIHIKGAETKYEDAAGKVYWRVLDSLGNEIWYTERK